MRPRKYSDSKCTKTQTQNSCANANTNTKRFRRLLPPQVLIHAAGGGTGQIAVQLAKRAGFKVIGTCSTSKVDLCKSLGCDAVVDYSNCNDVAASVKVRVLNCIAPPLQRDIYKPMPSHSHDEILLSRSHMCLLVLPL